MFRTFSRLAFLLMPLFVACAAVSAKAAAFRSDRISVETRGSGPDVLLITGLSSHPQVWESTVAELPGYRYHLVHVSGFAGKPAGGNASGPVLEPVAEELVRYIATSGLSRPALVGFSMGGTWALMVAARDPDLVSGVMVVDMMPFMGGMMGAQTVEDARPAADGYRKTVSTETDAAWRQLVDKTIADQVRTESLRPVVVQQLLASDRKVSAQALYEGLTTDLRPELKDIHVPLTVLYATPPHGPVTPEQLEHAFRVSYANAPQAVLHKVADAYHFIMFDQPAVFREELRTFLQASEGPASPSPARPATPQPAAAGSAPQQPVQTSGCTGPEHRWMDYIVGEWRVVNTTSGKEFAQNHVEHIHGGCGIRESLRMRDGSVGSSTSFYNALEKQWHMFYHDNLGFYAHLTGVTNAEGRQELTAEVRFVYEGGRVRNVRQVFNKDEAGRPRQVGYLLNEKDLTWKMMYDLTFCPVNQGPGGSLPPCTK